MHIISGQLLGILFPIFSYSHSTVFFYPVVHCHVLWCAAVTENARKHRDFLYSKLTHEFSLF